MLAGRKLLLADDSVTIQKVIELTFADEGVRVVAFGNGEAAVEHLDEVAPDIVLADVYMPGKTGFEVCEYIKHNEKYKHIPVMLLVGSFEPFDEAEARRVGADDILTKPFQSIRRLIDRVGSLVGSRPADEREIPTAELPHTKEPAAPMQELDTDELARTTADTQPLPPDSLPHQKPAFAQASMSENMMETTAPDLRQNAYEDSLLDLGDIEPVNAEAETEDFVLDLEDDRQNGADSFTKLYDTPAPQRSFVEPAIVQTAPPVPSFDSNYATEAPAWVPDRYEAPKSYEPDTVAYEDQVHELDPEPISVSAEEVPVSVAPETAVSAAPASSGPVTADNLSPEMIDAIARRVVEMMSDSVVREIAWEVVPELAELMIKRQLEEKESQHQ